MRGREGEEALGMDMNMDVGIKRQPFLARKNTIANKVLAINLLSHAHPLHPLHPGLFSHLRPLHPSATYVPRTLPTPITRLTYHHRSPLDPTGRSRSVHLPMRQLQLQLLLRLQRHAEPVR